MPAFDVAGPLALEQLALLPVLWQGFGIWPAARDWLRLLSCGLRRCPLLSQLEPGHQTAQLEVYQRR